MSKIARDFGSYVNDRTFDMYTVGEDKLEEDDIADLFIEFTKKQQKDTLKTEYYIKTWIDEWVHLFPEGLRSGGKIVRSDPYECLKKMVTFLKKYPYDRDLIFFSTKEYIRERAMNDYAYMRCATYFIHKLGVGSELAEWCEKCKNLDLTEEHRQLEIRETHDFI